MSVYVQTHIGDCLAELAKLPDESVNCCVTSPPYFGLRNYGHDGQVGLETTHDAYVARLVAIFREVRRVLRDDGVLWLNLGDSYANTNRGHNSNGLGKLNGSNLKNKAGYAPNRNTPLPPGLKSKDLIGIPWMAAFALRADGWYLRSDIIWSKPNPMPESVRDRCTRSHEYIFMLTKSPRYYFDSEANQEPCAESQRGRVRADKFGGNKGDEVHHSPGGVYVKGRGGKSAFRGAGHFRGGVNGPANRPGRDMADVGASDTRNRRSVWTIATKPYKGAHFATFPPDLIRPCILAGCPVGGTVLDPFAGSGTTAQVCIETGRRALLIELNEAYATLIQERVDRACDALVPKPAKARRVTEAKLVDVSRQMLLAIA